MTLGCLMYVGSAISHKVPASATALDDNRFEEGYKAKSLL